MHKNVKGSFDMKSGNYYKVEYFSLYDSKDEKINVKKILIFIILALILLMLIIIFIYTMQSINMTNIYKQYESQIIEMQKQNEQIKSENKIPILTELGKQNINNIYNSDYKRAFLTFDDGPSIVTPTILQILKQERVKATFFMLGSRVEVMPEIVKKTYEEGHYIANHGYSHVYSSIYESPETVLNEYNMCNNAVRNAIGVQDYNSYLFRYPGGFVGGKYKDIKVKSEQLLLDNNIMHVDWNALTGDSEKQDLTSEYLMERLRNTINGKNSIVILMHDSQAKKITADILPEVISYLKEQGYKFENFYEIIK